MSAEKIGQVEFDAQVVIKHTRYIYDAYELIRNTPESEDLYIGFAKLNPVYTAAGKKIPTATEDKILREFIGRPDSKRKGVNRSICIAQASSKSYTEFKAVINDFIVEDFGEAAAKEAASTEE